MSTITLDDVKDGYWPSYARQYPEAGTQTWTVAEVQAPEFQDLVAKAQKLWTDLTLAEIEKNGDGGSCVLGNGLYVLLRRPRSKSVFGLQICRPVGMGSLACEATYPQVLRFLANSGLKAWYEYGRLD